MRSSIVCRLPVSFSLRPSLSDLFRALPGWWGGPHPPPLAEGFGLVCDSVSPLVAYCVYPLCTLPYLCTSPGYHPPPLPGRLCGEPPSSQCQPSLDQTQSSPGGPIQSHPIQPTPSQSWSLLPVQFRKETPISLASPRLLLLAHSRSVWVLRSLFFFTTLPHPTILEGHRPTTTETLLVPQYSILYITPALPDPVPSRAAAPLPYHIVSHRILCQPSPRLFSRALTHLLVGLCPLRVHLFSSTPPFLCVCERLFVVPPESSSRLQTEHPQRAPAVQPL
jgi:hypothetical protein